MINWLSQLVQIHFFSHTANCFTDSGEKNIALQGHKTENMSVIWINIIEKKVGIILCRSIFRTTKDFELLCCLSSFRFVLSSLIVMCWCQIWCGTFPLTYHKEKFSLHERQLRSFALCSLVFFHTPLFLSDWLDLPLSQHHWWVKRLPNNSSTVL